MHTQIGKQLTNLIDGVVHGVYKLHNDVHKNNGGNV